MQIGEILFRPGRAVERFDVRGELDQIAGDKSRGESKITQKLNEQPARVAARTRPVDKRLLRRLHSRLHADQVFDVAGEFAVELYKERNATHLFARNRSQVTLEERGQGLLSQVSRWFYLLPRFVFERIILGVGLQEKIERVNNRHLGDEVDFDAKFPRRLWENQARKVIRLRILLP